MTSRKQQAIATKQKLLDTAEALIKENGFENVTVDDIVAACGVAKGTFYHYFETKDELIVYLTRTPYEELTRNFEATEGQPWLTRLRLFMQDWFHMVEKFNLNFSEMYHRQFLTSNYAGSSERPISQIDQGREIIQACLKGAVESGELTSETPVDAISTALIFSMQGCAVYQSQNAETFEVASWAKTFIPLVFQSILKPYLDKH